MNPSKATSQRQWLVWQANGAVQPQHSNPAIAKTLRRFARAKLQGLPGSEALPTAVVTQIRGGDLVIHVPADGSRGRGPLYVDWDARDNHATVSVLTHTMLAHMFGLPCDELVVVGHYDVPSDQRFGNVFRLEVLRLMQPVIDAAKASFYDWFPTFTDGRTQVWLSQMQASNIRSGFIADGTTTDPTNPECSWDGPGTVKNQIVYSVPADGHRARIESTAERNKFLVVTDVDGERRVFYAMLVKG